MDDGGCRPWSNLIDDGDAMIRWCLGERAEQPKFSNEVTGREVFTKDRDPLSTTVRLVVLGETSDTAVEPVLQVT
jgi:hypothetical protein